VVKLLVSLDEIRREIFLSDVEKTTGIKKNKLYTFIKNLNQERTKSKKGWGKLYIYCRNFRTL